MVVRLKLDYCLSLPQIELQQLKPKKVKFTTSQSLGSVVQILVTLNHGGVKETPKRNEDK